VTPDRNGGCLLLWRRSLYSIGGLCLKPRNKRDKGNYIWEYGIYNQEKFETVIVNVGAKVNISY